MKEKKPKFKISFEVLSLKKNSQDSLFSLPEPHKEKKSFLGIDHLYRVTTSHTFLTSSIYKDECGISIYTKEKGNTR